MTDYAPMYSSHDHNRKTHIAVSGGPSLCGIEKRYGYLMWTQGADYYSVEEQFLIDNSGTDRNGYLRCRKAYLKHREQMKTESTRETAERIVRETILVVPGKVADRYVNAIEAALDAGARAGCEGSGRPHSSTQERDDSNNP